MHCACGLLEFREDRPGVRGAYVFKYDSETPLDHLRLCTTNVFYSHEFLVSPFSPLPLRSILSGPEPSGGRPFRCGGKA